MSRLPDPARCVTNDEPRRERPALPDAVVIVVIAVLACALTVNGLDVPSVLAVLGGAGAVAAGTLTAARGGARRIGHRLVRGVQAVTAH